MIDSKIISEFLITGFVRYIHIAFWDGTSGLKDELELRDHGR